MSTPLWIAVIAALVVLIGVRTWVLDIYYVGSQSMQPTIEPGDRILSDQMVDASQLQRGDLVIFDGRGSFAPVDADPPLVEAGQRLASWAGIRPTDDIFVKRVIGVPGDTVACCAADGRLTVNGEPLEEPYAQAAQQPVHLPPRKAEQLHRVRNPDLAAVEPHQRVEPGDLSSTHRQHRHTMRVLVAENGYDTGDPPIAPQSAISI